MKYLYQMKINKSQHIVHKTQHALEAVKQYETRKEKEVENYLLRFGKHEEQKQVEHNHHTEHYNYHKELKPDQGFRVQLFPYADDFFELHTKHFIFPIRIIMRHVSNEATLFVGYDQEFPGISPSDSIAPELSSLINPYRFKSSFHQDKIITLHKPEHIPRIVYLTLQASSEFTMFLLKVDFIGYEGMTDDQYYSRRVRTESPLSTLQLSKTIEPTQKQFASSHIKKEKQASILFPSKSQKKIFPVSLKIEKKSRGMNQEKKKNFILFNHDQARTISRKSLLIQLLNKKQVNKQIQLKVRQKKDTQELAKEKSALLGQTSQKFKKQIQLYNKQYKKQQKIKEKMNKKLNKLIFGALFVLKAQNIYQQRSNQMSQVWRLRHLVDEFSQRLKKKVDESKALISDQKQRLGMSIYLCTSLQSKLCLSNKAKKASSVLFDVFKETKLSLVGNSALNYAAQYRRKIRYIQRQWLSKYRARLNIFMNFSFSHVQAMIQEHPHLKYLTVRFEKQNICQMLVKEYVKQESLKYRDVYRQHKLTISAMKSQNRINEIKQQKRRGKFVQIYIEKKEEQPQPRLFRNQDLLKSKIRKWFELEFKKSRKLNKLKQN